MVERESEVPKHWEALMYKQESLPFLVLPKIWHQFLDTVSLFFCCWGWKRIGLPPPLLVFSRLLWKRSIPK